MKCLAVLLSVFFLVLTTAPCGDSTVDTEQTTIEVSQHVDIEHGHSSGLCTPFCSCHCCHVHTIDFNLMAFEPIQPAISQNIFVHFNSAGQEHSLSPFQPPRV